jgi:hypothetical protein
MPILNVDINQVGQAGVFPAIIYILTNDTLDEVSATGYLNEITEKFRIPLTDADMALVATKTSPSASSTQTAWLSVFYSNGNWSLVPNSNSSSGLLNIQTFISSGIYTPTFGVKNVLVQCLGAGGAGGGVPLLVALATGSIGGGGGSGGYSQSYIPSATVGASQTVTIGIGGTGVPGGNGNSGGLSSFGSLVIAGGGIGGRPGVIVSGSSFTIGGAGGSEGTGDLTINGTSGISGLFAPPSSVISGAGGSGIFGGGALGTVGPHTAGVNAQESSGGGGSGASNTNLVPSALAGGHGGSGYIVIYEYS